MEIKPVGRTPIGEVCGGLSSVGGTPGHWGQGKSVRSATLEVKRAIETCVVN